MCPGEPAAERTAGAALEEPVRSRVTPEAGGYSGKPGVDGPWPRPLLGGGVCVEGHVLCARAPPEPPPRPRACGVRRWHSEKAHPQSLGRAALGRWAAAAGAGRGPAPAVLPQLGLGTPGGRSRLGRPATSSYLSAHFLAPASVPPHPRSLASLCDALVQVRNYAERNCNCTQEDTIAGARGVARGGEATRVASERVGRGKRGVRLQFASPGP